MKLIIVGRRYEQMEQQVVNTQVEISEEEWAMDFSEFVARGCDVNLN